MSTWIKKKVNGVQELSDKDTPKNFQEIKQEQFFLKRRVSVKKNQHKRHKTNNERIAPAKECGPDQIL